MTECSDNSEAIVDFFVVPKIRGPGNKQSWLVYRRSLNVCVDAAGDAEAAVAKAIKMAEFCMLGGQAAQVHLRHNLDAQWSTVWRPSLGDRGVPQ